MSGVRAADPPAGSIVAQGAQLLYRYGRGFFPWTLIRIGRQATTQVSDRHIDDLLTDGATVLRHGYGEDRP